MAQNSLERDSLWQDRKGKNLKDTSNLKKKTISLDQIEQKKVKH